MELLEVGELLLGFEHLGALDHIGVHHIHLVARGDEQVLVAIEVHVQKEGRP